MSFIQVTDTSGNILAINIEKIVRVVETKEGRPMVCFDNGNPSIIVRTSYSDFISKLNSH